MSFLIGNTTRVADLISFKGVKQAGNYRWACLSIGAYLKILTSFSKTQLKISYLIQGKHKILNCCSLRVPRTKLSRRLIWPQKGVLDSKEMVKEWTLAFLRRRGPAAQNEAIILLCPRQNFLLFSSSLVIPLSPRAVGPYETWCDSLENLSPVPDSKNQALLLLT